MFARILRRQRPDDQAAESLYRALVAQARQPDFYRRLGVPDTVEGRLEMILLHLVLLFHRLRRDDKAGQALAQGVFDHFVSDMDRSLREMGVGDLGVPKRMKAIGRSFYGRLESYGKALGASAEGELAEALQRNLWPDTEAPAGVGVDVAAYAQRAVSALHGQDFAAIAGGSIDLPPPVVPVAESAE